MAGRFSIMTMSGDIQAERRDGHLAFLLLLGLGGWGLLLAARYAAWFGPPTGPDIATVPFLIFLVVIVAARGMAFQLLPRNVVSLDSAFYVAATICLGAVNAGLLVALALTLDTLIRLLGRPGEEGLPAGDGSESLSYVLYFGGMTGALITSVGWLYGVDALRADGGAWRVLGTVAAVGATILVAHYAIQGARQRLLGVTVPAYLRQMALPGILAELSLVPLATVVVLVYDPDQPLGLALLGMTYLLLNFMVNRLSRASRALRARVAELETLNGTSRKLAAALQLHELVEAVAHESMRALPAADLLTFAHEDWGGDSDELVIEIYDRDREVFAAARAGRTEGATGWVMEHGSTLHIGDLERCGLPIEGLADSGVRSWLGTPILMYGTVRGVLALQSRRLDAFSDDDRRLLDSIGVQVSAALQNAHLYELAMVDGLTGLFVRRYFDARLDEEIERARRYGTTFSLVMMDLDDFKNLNDTHGHQAGDAVLRAVADVVRLELRGVDTAARYGGEEIAMVLPRTEMVSAYNLCERVRVAIAERQVAAGGEALSVTASFGIAAYPESAAGNAAELIRLADRALYRAKKTGKDRVELYWADGEESPGKSSIRSL